jgi:hypothetical protein
MVSIKLEGLDKALEALSQDVVRKAARQSVRRVAVAGRVVVSTEIRKVYNVKARDLEQRIKVDNGGDLSSTIVIQGKSMSLSYFGAKQFYGRTVVSRSKTGLVKKKSRKLVGPRPSGVQVGVMTGKTTMLAHTFMAQMRNGHIGVFRRLGKKRLPIDEKNVVSFATMAQNAAVEPAVIARIQERWATEFPRQLEYFRSKAGK